MIPNFQNLNGLMVTSAAPTIQRAEAKVRYYGGGASLQETRPIFDENIENQRRLAGGSTSNSNFI